MTRRSEIVPARLAPLAILPLFHKMEGRKAVVAGGSPGALWKAELLSAAGADVLVLAGHTAAARLFDGLVRQPVRGEVIVLARAWAPDDLEGAALAVGDFSGADDAESFAAAARSAGAITNIVDRPELGDVRFGTIVNRSPIVLGISTDGSAPMLGQSIRARIEAVLPAGLSAWAEAASVWRKGIRARFAGFADRRSFWERFVSLAWAEAERAPGVRDYRALVDGVPAPRGRVILVGAGPGAADLLTLKAVRALQAATVVLHDDLVGPDILELARREAIRIAVGKRGHGASVGQVEINRRLVELARAGETVVRLKGGDPAVFGRAAEEIEVCRAAGVEVSVIPGVTAAQAAAAALGISLTERAAARRVQYVTGHGADGVLPTDLDWEAIADPSTTTVIYMPRKTLPDFIAKARAHGLDPLTPAAAVASATLPDEARLVGTVADIASLAARLPQGAPVTIILGRVVGRASAFLAAISRAA